MFECLKCWHFKVFTEEDKKIHTHQYLISRLKEKMFDFDLWLFNCCIPTSVLLKDKCIIFKNLSPYGISVPNKQNCTYDHAHNIS